MPIAKSRISKITITAVATMLVSVSTASSAEWIILLAPATTGAQAKSLSDTTGKRCKTENFWVGSANLIGGKDSKFIAYAGPYSAKSQANTALKAVKGCAPKARVASADFSEPE